MKLPKALSAGEETLAFHLDQYKILYTREYQFDQTRRYRADFFIQPNLLIEVEGGTYSRGRHNQPKGYEQDCKKYNLATLNGFRLLRFTSAMVISGEAIDTILRGCW